jgi:hypothetical protein
VGSNSGVDCVDRDVTVIIGYHGGSGVSMAAAGVSMAADVESIVA